MAGHEIGHQILLFAKALGQLEITRFETVINLDRGLAHVAENAVTAMLWSNLQLSANVIANQLLEEGFVLIINQIVETDTRTDEDLLHLRQGFHLLQKFHVLAVIHFKLFTRRRSQALAVGTHTMLHLFVAGRIAEIRRRTANVMNIAFESGKRSKQFRFVDYALDGTGTNASSLMECQRAEITGAEASTVVGEGKFHLGDTWNAAVLVIDRVRTRV